MGTGKELYCPGCGGRLREVWAEANYGRVLLLDQCDSCGGVWFDRWELYFVKPASLKSLHAVDFKTFLSENPFKKGSGECPRCSVSLVSFNDPLLPKDATIKRCERCSGLWLNRGDLSKYAIHREAHRGPDGPAAELSTLKHLQKELNTKNLGRPTTLELASALENEPPIDTREVVKDMGFLILQSLLRLVFKF